jgi:signal transduction histidine kinase
MPGGWTLRLQHRAGSLAAAVERARQRNLLLSFGILGVLVASVGLVMMNARRAERLAARQMDFVATVSHELRTPVAVIRSAAQNLSAGIVQDPAQARRYGEVIETEGRRLTDMVEHVLEYAGLSGKGRPPISRPVDAAALAREVVDTAVATSATALTFDLDVEPGTPAVMIDPDALRRALQNLVGNAVKHAGDGGWIGVSVARDADARRVRLSVADRGPGIAPEDLPHVFDPFYRGRRAVDRQVQGNGLGLSLVKRIAEAHGGRVRVTSVPGEGATFTIAVPAASGAAEAAANAPALSLDRPAHPAEPGSA